MLKVKLSLSTAECNCLIEAIEAANKLVDVELQVYADGNDQQAYAGITSDIAKALKQLIEDEETAIIAFEP